MDYNIILKEWKKAKDMLMTCKRSDIKEVKNRIAIYEDLLVRFDSASLGKRFVIGVPLGEAVAYLKNAGSSTPALTPKLEEAIKFDTVEALEEFERLQREFTKYEFEIIKL